MHPSARDPARRMVRRDSGICGLFGFGVFGFFFPQQKALAARCPLFPGPRHLPFTPTPHLPGTRAARCFSRQTMGSGLARQPAPGPRPHSGPPAPLRDPERAERGGWRGTEKSEAGEATKGKVGASPLGQEARSRHGEKRRGRGSAEPPRPEPRGPAAHSPARWQIAPPVHLARASAASKARCAP